MKKIFGTVFATIGVAGLMLFALSSNTNTQSENPNTRVLTEEETAPVEEDEQIVKQFNSFTS
jgi:hypothetical protein